MWITKVLRIIFDRNEGVLTDNCDSNCILHLRCEKKEEIRRRFWICRRGKWNNKSWMHFLPDQIKNTLKEGLVLFFIMHLSSISPRVCSWLLKRKWLLWLDDYYLINCPFILSFRVWSYFRRCVWKRYLFNFVGSDTKGWL